MALKLIPVIEIGYNNLDIPTPDRSPYWEYPILWDRYNAECYKKAGFKDDLKPYLAGSSFYRLSEITDSNLTKLVIDHTQGIGSGKYERDAMRYICSSISYPMESSSTNKSFKFVRLQMIKIQIE